MSSPSITPVSLPPHNFMPPDGIAFDYAAYIATPAIGANGVVVTFTVPEGFNGVIKRIGNVYVGAGFVDGSGALVWQIVENSGVVRNYDNIVASLGAVNNPSEVAGILVKEQEVIELVVSNVSLAAGATQIGGRLSGWFYSTSYITADIWG